MSFYRKYELDRLIASGETKTFRATEKNSGRAVFLHLFEPEARSLIRELRDKLENGGQAQPPLIEIGEFAEAPYAVTEMLDPFPGLRPWIQSLSPRVQPAPAAAESPEPLLPTPAKPAPGEFTRLFLAPADPQRREPQAPTPPGEFTRLFEPAQPPAKSPVHDPPSFRKPAPVEAVPRIPLETSDFTRLFGPGLHSEAIDIEQEQERARSLPVAGGRPFEPAGDFTRMFGPHPATPDKPAVSEAPPPLLETKLATGLATSVSRMFGRPQSERQSDRLPQAPPPDKGPGEYTRLIAGSGSQPPPPGRNEPAPSSAVAAPPPLARPGKTKFRLIAVIAVLFVLLVVLLLLTRR